jgi:hypothetical protein
MAEIGKAVPRTERPVLARLLTDWLVVPVLNPLLPVVNARSQAGQ